MFGLSALATKAIAAGVILAALWFVWHQVTTSYYDKGKAATEAAYAKRDQNQRDVVAKEVERLKQEALDIEAVHAVAVAAAQNQREKENAIANKTISDLRTRIARGFRLFDPFAKRTTDCGGSAPAQATATTPVGNGPTGSELSEQVTQFLTAEADRADAVVRQLTELQQEAEALQKACVVR